MKFGTFSRGKKVLHRKVMGRIKKVENLAMSPWELATMADRIPNAAKVIPLSSIIRKNAGLNWMLAPKGMDSSRISRPLYIPRKAPPSIWPKI